MHTNIHFLCNSETRNPVRDSITITDWKCGFFRWITTTTQPQPWIGLHRGIYCATHSGVDYIAGILSAGRLRTLHALRISGRLLLWNP